jgi:hypothetical protein
MQNLKFILFRYKWRIFKQTRQISSKGTTITRMFILNFNLNRTATEEEVDMEKRYIQDRDNIIITIIIVRMQEIMITMETQIMKLESIK